LKLRIRLLKDLIRRLTVLTNRFVLKKILMEKEKDDAGQGIFTKHELPSLESTQSLDVLAADPNEGTEQEQAIPDEKPSESQVIHTTSLYIGLKVKPKQSTGESRKLDLSWPIQEFKKLVSAWDKYEEDSMGLFVGPIKSSGLPLEVFGGEDAAIIKKKKKSSSSKRKMDDSVTEAKRAKLLSEQEDIVNEEVMNEPIPKEVKNEQEEGETLIAKEKP
jgi:hypothetical protein